MMSWRICFESSYLTARSSMPKMTPLEGLSQCDNVPTWHRLTCLLMPQYFNDELLSSGHNLLEFVDILGAQTLRKQWISMSCLCFVLAVGMLSRVQKELPWGKFLRPKLDNFVLFLNCMDFQTTVKKLFVNIFNSKAPIFLKELKSKFA